MNKNKKMWEPLSDLFVDNEIDYEYIASCLSNYPINEIDNALFMEVAPVCYANLMTPIPEVWQGFSAESLEEEIIKQNDKLRKSSWFRFKHKLVVVFCRNYFKHEWSTLKAEIIKKQTSPEIS